MSASYSCGTCGSTSGSQVTCHGQPMENKATVTQATTAALTVSRWGNAGGGKNGGNR